MISTASAYDTHKSFKRLVEAEIPEKQAEAIIDCMSGSQSDWATKADIARLEEATKADFARLEEATKADFARLEATTATKEDLARLEASTRGDIKLLRWMVGFNLALTAAVLLALIL